MPEALVPDANTRVFGWSGGYVAFSWTESLIPDASEGGAWLTTAMFSASSTDGVHWTAERPVDTSVLWGGLFDPYVVEGPAGLLLVGYPEPGGCVGQTVVEAMWSSSDGETWAPGALPNGVYTMAAGPTGYIATGSAAGSPAIWVSTDGRSWRTATLPQQSQVTDIDNATDFAGGYVVAGERIVDGSCVGAKDTITSLWWSPDGRSWTLDELPGAEPSADNVYIHVLRISDHVLIANTIGGAVWRSIDGQNWDVVPSPSAALLNRGSFLADSEHCLAEGASASVQGHGAFVTIADDLSTTTLRQSGDFPVAGESYPGLDYALGPTGLLALSSDGITWIGLPAAS
jgi:hypothetical protein